MQLANAGAHHSFVGAGDDWPFGYVLCQIWLSVDYTASTASIFNLSILSVDRYWSITSPLRYLRRRTKKRALIMIALAWTGASMWVIPVLGWHHFIPDGVRQQPGEAMTCTYFVRVHGLCLSEGVCDTEFASNVTFKVVTSILNFYIPTSCIVVLYVRIFLAIRRRSRDIERLGGQTSTPRQHDHNSCSTLRTVGTAAETTTFGGGDSLSSSDGEDDEEDEDEEENGFVVSVEFGRLAVLAIHDAHYHKEGALQSLTLFEDVNVRVQYESGDNSREKQHSYGCCGCGNSKGSKKTPSPVNVSRQPLDRSDKVVRDSGHSRHLHCYRSSKPSKQADSPSTPFCLNIGTKEAQGREPRSVRWWCCRSSAPRAASASSSSSAPRLRVHQHNPNVVLAKEKKAARQLGVIVGAFILCWLPYFTLFIVVSYCKECVDQTLFDTSVWFGYFNSSLNPILYPLCNANFKRAFKRMLMQLPLLHIRTQAREQGHRERKSKKKHPVAIDARDECNQT